MTVFFAHVGDENSKRDFPRTIGTYAGVLLMDAKSFGRWSDLVPKGFQNFQTWGIPEKADPIHRKLSAGDWFVLVGTIGSVGGVEYIGKVTHVLHEAQPDLSEYLWTEARFPWIFLMSGKMTFVSWSKFLSVIGYAPNFDPRGRIYPVSKQKMALQNYENDFALIEALETERERLGGQTYDPDRDN